MFFAAGTSEAARARDRISRVFRYGYIILTLYCITYNMYILCLVSKDAFSLQGLVRVYDLRSSRPLAERDHMTLGDPMV